MADEKPAKGAHGGEAPSLDATIWSRRDIFSLAGWAGVVGVIGASLLAFTRFMFPRVLFEPSPVFAADRPENFPSWTRDRSFGWHQEYRPISNTPRASSGYKRDRAVEEASLAVLQIG